MTLCVSNGQNKLIIHLTMCRLSLSAGLRSLCRWFSFKRTFVLAVCHRGALTSGLFTGCKSMRFMLIRGREVHCGSRMAWEINRRGPYRAALSESR